MFGLNDTPYHFLKERVGIQNTATLYRCNNDNIIALKYVTRKGLIAGCNSRQVKLSLGFRGKFNISLIRIPWLVLKRSIGVRGVFLRGGGISQPSILLTCFNSAGGANAGLRKSLRGMSHYPFFGENFVLTNLGPRILDRCTHEGKTFLWKTILSSKTVS